MESLIVSSTSRSTAIAASRSWQAMSMSAALEVRTFTGRSCDASDYRPVNGSKRHGSTLPTRHSDLLINDLSTTDLAGPSYQGDQSFSGEFAGTKRIQGLNASMGADNTRLGSRPPSPPV